MQMTRPPMSNLPSHSNLFTRFSIISGKRRAVPPETIALWCNKQVFSNLLQRDVATEVGCSARLASAQPMVRFRCKPPIRIRRFRTKECCTAFDYTRAERLQEKDAPRVCVGNYSTCTLPVAGKRQRCCYLCFNMKALMD